MVKWMVGIKDGQVVGMLAGWMVGGRLGVEKMNKWMIGWTILK